MSSLSTGIVIVIFILVTFIFIFCYRSLPKNKNNKNHKNNKNTNEVLSPRKEYLITSFSSLAITLFSIIGAFYFTVFYDVDKDKEKLEGMLKSAIHSTEVTIITINEQMDSIEENKSKRHANKYGDNIDVEDYSFYEPIPYYDVLPKILEDGDLFALLSDDSKYLLPEYTMNSKGIMEHYDTETNSYYNFLTLEHLKNNLKWQKVHLENELKYLNGTDIGFKNDKHSKKFYNALNDYLYDDSEAFEKLSYKDLLKFFRDPFIVGRIAYGEEWNRIEGNWKNYSEIKKD